ncbi:MAG: hypothetical protein PHP54_05510 [Clostridia bacterium]|nr:hypothetical protein [Clostridia bacterium]
MKKVRKTISILTGSTERCIQEFKVFFPLFAKEQKVVSAKINYEIGNIPTKNTPAEEYPLIIYTNDLAFCLGDVSAGYGGTGPHGTVEVLKWLDFQFDENEVYKRRENGITSFQLTI